MFSIETVVYGVGVVVKFSKLKNTFIYFVYEGYYKYYATVHICTKETREKTSILIFFWFLKKVDEKLRSHSSKYRLIQIDTN